MRIARIPFLGAVLARLGLVSDTQSSFIEFARTVTIHWADVTRRIPEATGSVDVIYASHMFEHLEADEAASFLMEALRVLKPGGVLRLAVPDLRYHVQRYLEDGDADGLMSRLYVTVPPARGIRAKLLYLAVGRRQHKWMYDAASLTTALRRSGFTNVVALPPGQTTIPDPGVLDLFERAPESLFVECRRPGAPTTVHSAVAPATHFEAQTGMRSMSAAADR